MLFIFAQQMKKGSRSSPGNAAPPLSSFFIPAMRRVLWQTFIPTALLRANEHATTKTQSFLSSPDHDHTILNSHVKKTGYTAG